MARVLNVWITLTVVATVLLVGASAVATNARQQQVLQNILTALPLLGSGPSPSNLWTSAKIADACNSNMYGIAGCNAEGWVTDLSFSSYYHLGAMPAAFGDMEGLKTLYAYYTFEGALPSALSRCSNLTRIDLYANMLLEGGLPDSWAALGKMEEFRYYGSKRTVSAPFPSWAGSHWRFLKSFSWTHQTTSATFPDNFVNLNQLQSLDLSNCAFTGTVPAGIFQSQLSVLNLANNRLSGSIPEEIVNTRLSVAYFQSNEFSGNLPSNLPAQLQQIDLQQNRLNGTIPQSWLNGALTNLRLANNDLSGNIPWPATATTGGLREYSLSFNPRLTGTFPSFFWQLSRLDYFYADSIYGMTGALPATVPSSGCNIKHLVVSHSQVSGTIPARLDNCRYLIWLQFTNNSISGTLPETITQFPDLQFLIFDQNRLTGTIPSNWTGLPKVNYVWLQQNQLTGTVPISLLEIPTLNDLYLQNNSLSLCSPGLTNASIPAIACDVTYQEPRECGCPEVWGYCLTAPMDPVCPPPPPQEPISAPIDASPEEIGTPTLAPDSNSPLTPGAPSSSPTIATGGTSSSNRLQSFMLMMVAIVAVIALIQ